MAIANLSTHQNFVSDRLRATQSRVIAAAGVVDVHVVIDAGPQAGAARTLRVAELTVGADESNDVILIDPKVGAAQARVTFERSMFGTLATVTAEGADIQVGDQQVMAGETLEAVKLPVALAMGSNTLTLSAENQRAPRPQRRFDEWFSRFDPILTAAVLALLVLMLWSLFSAYVLNGEARHAVSVNAPVLANASVANTDRDWITELRREVDTNGLADTLRVNDEGLGIIRVSGPVSTGKDPALRNLQSWYDSQPAAPTVIWDILRDTALDGMPQVAMIRFVSPPHVLLEDGETVQLGESMVDGWVLTQLSPEGMVLSRGAEQNILTFEELLK